MKSWGLLIFAGALSVGTANVELYSFYKETDTKHSDQANDASLLQVPVGLQLQLVPSQMRSQDASGTVLLARQSYLPGSYLRASDLTAAVIANDTGHHILVRSDPVAKAANETTTKIPELPKLGTLMINSGVLRPPVPSNDTKAVNSTAPIARTQFLLPIQINSPLPQQLLKSINSNNGNPHHSQLPQTESQLSK